MNQSCISTTSHADLPDTQSKSRSGLKPGSLKPGNPKTTAAVPGAHYAVGPFSLYSFALSLPGADISALSPETCVESRKFRGYVFNNLESVLIPKSASSYARRIANSLWPRIESATSFKACRVDDKRRAWECIVAAALLAGWLGGCIRYGRSRSRTPAITQQIIACAVESRLLISVPSKPNGKHFSRLLVSQELMGYVPEDPSLLITSQTLPPLVRMQSRESKRVLSFELGHPIAAASAEKLALINEVNSRANITFKRFWRKPEYCLGMRKIQPFLTRLFHENWWHGRLYNLGRFGHTNLRKSERSTVQFNGEASVELDFSAFHARMIYHLCGLPYTADPYQLWGPNTSDAQRKLAKLVINISINAPTRALQACEAATWPMRNGKQKTGRDRERASNLRKALRESDLTLEDVDKLARRVHWRISRYFGSGMGAELMRLDSEIALDVLYALAEQGIPALGVHDSFIVPSSCGDELRRLMMECYFQRLGFYPELK